VGDADRVPLFGQPRSARAWYRCPKCETVVIAPEDDPTRTEMVARWQKLVSESPRK
jgi:hypothetical protein